jgi:hypothetical protein
MYLSTTALLITGESATEPTVTEEALERTVMK